MPRLPRALGPALAVVLTLGLAALAPRPSAGQAGDFALEDFHGAWAFRSGQGDLDDGIDRVADALNLFIREIARGELHRRIRPERRVRLAVDGTEHVTLTWDQWGPHRIALGAAPRSLRGPDGSQIDASMTFRNGTLVHHHVGGGGARYTTYSLGDGGQRMTMAVRITSDQLPVDLRYRLQYRRE